MPIYEYRCTECRRLDERLERMDENTEGPCLDVHEQADGLKYCFGRMTKIVSASQLRLNGIAPSGSDAPPLHNVGNKVARVWMNPDGTTESLKDWRPAFNGDPGRAQG